MNPHTPNVVHQVATSTSGNRGISKWWPISFLISAVIFLIIGGGLWGGSNSSRHNCRTSGPYCSIASHGEFYGAIGCFALGVVLKIAGWILLIVYLVKRRRLRATTITHINAPTTDKGYHSQHLPTYSGGPQCTHMSPASTPMPIYNNAPLQFHDEIYEAPSHNLQSPIELPDFEQPHALPGPLKRTK